MDEKPSPSSVVCRPGRMQDHADVTEFCKGIWDGDDYVPDVWEDWVNESNGLLAVAEWNGHAIGCSKISWMSKGQWWLEGFRVDPAYQGLKIGACIHDYVTDWWLAHGDGTLRLMTDAGNVAVHRLCLKTGYVKTHEVCGYKADPLAEPIENFSPVVNKLEAAQFGMESESIQTTDGLLDFGWRIGLLDEAALDISSQADRDHTFYWWNDRQGLLSAWINEDDSQNIRTLNVGVVACALSDMPALLMDARRLAAQQKLDFVFQIAFDIPAIVAQLDSAGFEKKWKRSNAFVFEKQHPDRV